MRTLGEIDHGARCGEHRGDAATVRADALPVLRAVYHDVVAWRWEHRRLPATDAELVEVSPRAANDPDFTMGLTPVANGGFCLHIAPQTRGRAPPPVALSLDGGGNVYEGDGCGGRPVEHF